MREISCFYTIGHATREINEFANLLSAQNITLLVDVRSVPRSRTNPQYNLDILPRLLASYRIEYLHIPELGGFRAKSKTIPSEINGYWEHKSFHNYADYAMGESFQNALERLLDLGKNQSVAIMCAEMLWWRCHRRIIADYLLIKRQKVFHIINVNNIKPAILTAAGHVLAAEVISYPSKHNIIR